MKKLLVAFAIFLLAPSVSFAAALTSQQSSSLIAVVQSSPGTPASAFVSLITSFSNITVSQAISLIVVVQSAPSASASAFVNLLISFTVDTPATQSAASAVSTVAYANSCNGSQYPACMNGQQFVCPSNSAGYCLQNNTSQTSVPVVSTPPVPQTIEQKWMNKFLTDASNAVGSMESSANSAVSSISNIGSCSNVASFSVALISQICTYMYQGVTAISNLQNWASSVQDSYRSASCDYKLYYPLEQALQAIQSGTAAAAGAAGTPGLVGNQTARANQIINSTNAQVSAFEVQAQLVVSSCQ